MLQEKKYKAFICYSHADERWGRWLHRTLETYRTPKRLIQSSANPDSIPSRLNPVFRDRDELASSPDLSERIESALRNSENLIVICSPSAAKSKWVNREIELFKLLGKSDHIYCLIVDGDPSTQGSTQDCFPPELRVRYNENGSRVPGSAEPIAADLRQEGDGKRLARLKIIAGLLGVGLDELRRRDSQRRNQRMIAITAGSLAASFVTIALAITATLAMIEADQRRLQAEELLGFMVGDLRESLEPIGRLDLLESVGEQAQEYFEAVNLSNLSDEELLRQAEVLTQIGEIRFDQFAYEEALSSFTDAYERSAELYRIRSSDPERLFSRSQAEFWVGYIHWQIGSLEDAREWMQRYLESSLELVAFDPDRDEWEREVGYAYHNLAVLDAENGDLEAAASNFKQVVETLSSLQGQNPDLQLQVEIADAVSWLGNIARDQGALVDSLAYFNESASLHQSNSEANELNAIAREFHGIARSQTSQANLLLGNYEKAIEEASLSILLLEELVERDRSNNELKLDSVLAHLHKGQALFARGDLDSAYSEALLAIQTCRDIVATNTSNLNVHSALGQALLLQSQIEEEMGNFDNAQELNRSAETELRNLLGTGRADNEVFNALAMTRLSMVELQRAASELSETSTSLDSVQELLVDKVEQSQSALLLDPWTRYLFMSGRASEANAIVASLSSRGYVPLLPWPTD